MSKKMNWAVPLALGAAVGTFLYMTAPGRARPEQKEPFLRRNFAHRGLHDKRRGIPENSMAAFRAAAYAGYGVELDTRLTADGHVVVCHDDDLRRLTGKQQYISQLTFAQLQDLPLEGTGETVPLFSRALDTLCEAGVPVIVEVKPAHGSQRKELCSKVLAIMDEHTGALCVESFDPFIVRWFRKNAPDLLRGQLTSQYRDLGASKPVNFAISRLLTNFLGRPQFIAHRIGPKSLPVRLWEKLGVMKVCWTSNGPVNEKNNDAVIFEHYRPEVKY